LYHLTSDRGQLYTSSKLLFSQLSSHIQRQRVPGRSLHTKQRKLAMCHADDAPNYSLINALNHLFSEALEFCIVPTPDLTEPKSFHWRTHRWRLTLKPLTC
jgi:hypothetical protein